MKSSKWDSIINKISMSINSLKNGSTKESVKYYVNLTRWTGTWFKVRGSKLGSKLCAKLPTRGVGLIFGSKCSP